MSKVKDVRIGGTNRNSLGIEFHGDGYVGITINGNEHEQTVYTKDAGVREMSQSVSSHGYAKGYTGKPHGRMVFVHRLVAMAWCEGFADGLQVNHRDGNKLNNNASNLEWVTSSGNNTHAHAEGLRGDAGRGERNPMARLNDSDVAEIRAHLKDGAGCKRIANWYRVHPSTIYAIATGRSWCSP